MYMSRRGCALLSIGTKVPLRSAAAPGSTKEIKTQDSFLTLRSSVNVWRYSHINFFFAFFYFPSDFLCSPTLACDMRVIFSHQ